MSIWNKVKSQYSFKGPDSRSIHQTIAEMVFDKLKRILSDCLENS